MRKLSRFVAIALVSVAVTGVAVQSASARHRLGHERTKRDSRYRVIPSNHGIGVPVTKGAKCETVQTPRGPKRYCRY
jgi:hypothetical protein